MLLEPIVHCFRGPSNDHVLVGIRIVIVLPEPLNAQRIQFDVVKYRKTSQTAALSRNVFGLPRVGLWVTIPFAGAVKLQLEVVKAAF